MKAIKSKRILFVLLFTMLAGVWLSAFPAEASSSSGKKVTKKNDNFKVEVEYGLDHFATYDNPVLATVTIESKENFIGTLRLTPVMDSYMKTVAYGEEISLTAGESKTFSVIVSSVGSSGKVNLELLDEKDNVVYSETEKATLEMTGSKTMIGILSDDYSALGYLDGIAMKVNDYEGVTSIIELTKDSMPEEGTALAALQYIVIDNFDTAQLSDKQYSALKNWVNDGGVLILALGSNYKNVLNRFNDDFVTGTIGELGKKQLVWVSEQTKETSTEDNVAVSETESTESETNEENEQQENENSLADVDCVEFELNGGSEMTTFSTDQSAYQKDSGLGKVVVLSYALGMEPFVSYEGRIEVANSLLTNAWGDATENSLYGYSTINRSLYNATNVARLTDSSRKPSTILYAVILILYVILVGPGLYLILKAVQKREKIWVAVPVVTLLFTGIIYMTGFLYRVNKPILGTCSIITLDGNTQAERVYTDITCPKAEWYTINIKDEYSGFRYNADEYYAGVFDEGVSQKPFNYMLKKQSDGTQLIINNQSTFEENSFVVEKNGENVIGTIDSELKCTTTGIEGTVTNNTCYDLKSVVVTFEYFLYQVGDMKKGETITIDSSKIIQMSQYGTLAALYEKNDRLYVDNSVYLQSRIDIMMEECFVNKNAYNQGYIWATIRDYKLDMTKDSDVKQSGCGVIMQTYTAEYEDVKGVYYPSIDNMSISESGYYDGESRTIYESDVTITYSFEDYPGITTLVNLSQEQKEKNSNVYLAEVQAYNPELGIYETIFKDSTSLSGEELEKYLDGDVLILKYLSGSNDYSTQMPRIAAKGDE